MIKALMVLFSFLATFLIPQISLAYQAGAKLLGVTAKRLPTGTALDLTFDRAVSSKSLKPAFERNFIQFSLKATKMDSARIVQIGAGDLTKVFAYPYSPDTVRVRLIFSGTELAGSKARLQYWNNNARSIRLLVKASRAEAGAQAEPGRRKARQDAVSPPSPRSQARQDAVQPAPSSSSSPFSPPSPPSPDPAEEVLLKEVVANTREIDIHNPDSIKAAVAPLESGAVGTKSEPTKHFMKMIAALAGILALFLGAVFLLRKHASKLARLPFGKKERMIHVVATHYLGNKKSISMVKIAGEYMVIGVSNEGISLISRLGPEVNVDKYLEDRFWGGTFEKHLNSYAKDVKVMKAEDLQTIAGPEMSMAAPTTAATPTTPADQIAGQVTDRVELTRPDVRAGIREKLSGLRPLART